MTTKAANKKGFDPHAILVRKAESMLRQHIVKEEGEKCFNIFTYLERLGSYVEAEFIDSESKIGKALGDFELDGYRVARYLWCCVCLKEGADPYGTHFRGMPILD